MTPWVYLFSRFTSEALLFEALIIFTLCALYTGFWLVRKRKFGVIQKEVPAGVVKYYLNELIVDAEQLRAQLFGLLSGAGIPSTPLAGFQPGAGASETHATAPISIVAGDPESAKTLAALETKLAEQAKQIENFVSEKAKIEQELATAKQAGGAAAAPSADQSKLMEKISQLEAKLAEYSVIEDDLANLKRLQQENAALKSQISGAVPAGAGAAAPPAEATEAAAPMEAELAAAPAEEKPAAATKQPTPAQENGVQAQPGAEAAEKAAAAKEKSQVEAGVAAQAGQSPDEGNTAQQAQAQAKAAKAEKAATPGAPGLGASVNQAEENAADPAAFEGLVDQVEQSLQKPVAVEAEAAEEKGEVSSTTPNPTATIEKSDADLVAEFEKMLNG